jgi:hypothetical protein
MTGSSVNPIGSMILYGLQMSTAYEDYNFPANNGLPDPKTRTALFGSLIDYDRFSVIENLPAWSQMQDGNVNRTLDAVFIYLHEEHNLAVPKIEKEFMRTGFHGR